MSREKLDRLLDRCCRQLGVTTSEARFGRVMRRTGKLVTTARGLFLLRAMRLGATVPQLCAILEMDRSGVYAWLREFRSRGLLDIDEQVVETKEV